MGYSPVQKASSTLNGSDGTMYKVDSDGNQQIIGYCQKWEVKATTATEKIGLIGSRNKQTRTGTTEYVITFDCVDGFSDFDDDLLDAINNGIDHVFDFVLNNYDGNGNIKSYRAYNILIKDFIISQADQSKAMLAKSYTADCDKVDKITNNMQRNYINN